jgi:type IV secretory pathway VirB2 component (pilin)
LLVAKAMKLPFPQQQFFTLIERHIHAVWPTRIVLASLAVACVAAAFGQRGWDRAVRWVLGGVGA